MKILILMSAFLWSLSSMAGEMYLSCGFGEEEHWENFSDGLLDENKKGMIHLKSSNKYYVITFDNANYRYIKTDRNDGGYEEQTVMPLDTSSRKISLIVDNIWCHIND